MAALRVLLFAAVLVLAACTSSGRTNPSFASAHTAKTIFVSTYQSEYESRHINEVLRTFEKYGYEQAKDRAAATYYLDFSIKAGAIVTVRIALIKDGSTVLEVSSKNTGWGTVIARPVAISGRVTEALVELEDILSHAQ